MGTWEEGSVFLESHNEISKNVLSDETCYDGDDVDVAVNIEVVNVNVDCAESRDSETNVVAEEGDLVQHLERVDLHNNGSDSSKIDEESRENHVEYDDEGKSRVHPLRPYAVDCPFYIKNGVCRFGQSCRYNHPHQPKWRFQPVWDKEKRSEETIGSAGVARMIQCKYFQTPGGCKYGDACRFNHLVYRIEKKEHPELNFLGLPIRPSAQECAYYLQNGSCAYGAQCRFSHPDPSPINEFESGTSQANDESVRGSGVGLPINYDGVPVQSFGCVPQGTSQSRNGVNLRNGARYAPEISSYQQTIPQTPKWNQSQVTNSFPANKFPLPHQLVNNVSNFFDPLPHYGNPMQVEEFPERPGQPDCDYFMKTGRCKYKSGCRYNHPKGQVNKLPRPPFSSNGFNSKSNQPMHNGEFPERAGEPECKYYMKTGQCKFKSSCRYDHPRSRLSASSRCDLSENGLPLRPGAKVCRHEQQGTCKYGLNCLFNHPDDY